MSQTNQPSQIPKGTLKSHKQMQDETFTENPIVLLQTKYDEEAPWATERVFIDDDDLRRFLAPQKYRYPDGQENETWRGYVVPCSGHLADIVSHARLENHEEAPAAQS